MTANVRALPAQRGSRAGGVQVTAIAEDKAGTQLEIEENVARMRRGSALVPRVRIAARPASPRLRLMLEGGEADGSDRLLWQALVPGEQAAPVTLPAARSPTNGALRSSRCWRSASARRCQRCCRGCAWTSNRTPPARSG